MPARAQLERLYDEHAQALFAFLLNQADENGLRSKNITEADWVWPPRNF